MERDSAPHRKEKTAVYGKGLGPAHPHAPETAAPPEAARVCPMCSLEEELEEEGAATVTTRAEANTVRVRRGVRTSIMWNWIVTQAVSTLLLRYHYAITTLLLLVD